MRLAAPGHLQANACPDTYPTCTPRYSDTISAIFVGIWCRYDRYSAAPRKPSKLPVEDTPKILFGYGTLFGDIFVISCPSCVRGYVWLVLNRSECHTIGICARLLFCRFSPPDLEVQPHAWQRRRAYRPRHALILTQPVPHDVQTRFQPYLPVYEADTLGTQRYPESNRNFQVKIRRRYYLDMVP